MQAMLLSAILGIVAKLVTAEMIEFIIVKLLELAAARTDTKVDDEFVAKAKELLERK